jgi:hypothetical protein
VTPAPARSSEPRGRDYCRPLPVPQAASGAGSPPSWNRLERPEAVAGGRYAPTVAASSPLALSVPTAYRVELAHHQAAHRVGIVSMGRGRMKAYCSCGWQSRKFSPSSMAPGEPARSTTSSSPTRRAAVSADYQLWDLHTDPALALRGIPVIGAGAGAIRYTRPETCLDKLDRLQLAWLRAASAGTVEA